MHRNIAACIWGWMSHLILSAMQANIFACLAERHTEREKIVAGGHYDTLRKAAHQVLSQCAGDRLLVGSRLYDHRPYSVYWSVCIWHGRRLCGHRISKNGV